MKSGERVKLIEEAADPLADRDFPRAQMILDQVGIETYDIDGSWHVAPDEPTYLLQQLGKAGDDTLASVHAFLMGDDAQPETDPLGGPWRVDLPARAFLSHRHENRLLGLPRLWLTSLGPGLLLSRVPLRRRRTRRPFVSHDSILVSKVWSLQRTQGDRFS